MLTISLSKAQERRLSTLAQALGRTKAALAQEAVLGFIEGREDAIIAGEAYLEFKASGEKAIPLAEIGRRPDPAK
jgi:RHH-type rel operon transcriptional repressor/antitoxin RelB